MTITIPKQCDSCESTGYDPEATVRYCPACDGVGYTNLPPYGKCDAQPGSDMKVAYMAARYKHGRPLFNHKDNVEPRTIDDKAHEPRHHRLVIDGVTL